MKKTLIILTTILALALFLTACANEDTPATTPTPDSNVNGAPATGTDNGSEATGRTTVRVLLAGFPLDDSVDPITGAEMEGLQSFWDRTFTPYFPDIDVELVTVPWDVAQQTQQVELETGDFDVMYVGGYGFQFYLQGLLRYIDDLMDNDPNFDPNLFPQGLFNSAITLISPEGRHFGLPAVLGQRFTIFDTQIFDEWGVPHLSRNPSVQEILAAAEMMTGINPVTGEQNYGVWFDIGFPMARFTFDAWAYAFNATGGVGYIGQPADIQWALNSPEMFNLFEAYGQLVQFTPPGFLTATGGERFGSPDNNIAIVLDTNGGAIINEYRASGDDSMIQRFRPALNVGPSGEGWVAMDPIVMSARTQNPEAAWEVMKHLAGYQRQEWFYLNFGATPALANPGFLAAYDIYTPYAIEIAQHAQTTLIDSANPFYVAEIVPVVSQFQSDIISGVSVDIAALLEALQARAIEWSATQ